MKKSALIFAIAWIAVSCHDQAPSVTFLTVEDGGIRGHGQVAQWVFASDLNGKVLDAKRVDGAQVVALKSADRNLSTVDFTIVQKVVHNDQTNYVLKTFKNISAYNNLKINQPISPEPFSMVFPLKINLDNYKGQVTGGFIFSSFDHAINFSNGTTTTGSGEYYCTVYVPNQELDMVISSNRNGEPVYWKGKVAPGEISIDFAALLPQENVLALPPGSTGTVYGRQDASADKFARISDASSTLIAPAKIGYVPGYNHYTTSVYVPHPSEGCISALIEGGGAPLEQLSVAPPTMSIIEGRHDSFSMSATTPYIYKSVTWNFSGQKNTIQWTVYSDADDNGQIRSDFPDELKKEGYFITKENFRSAPEVKLTVSDGSFTYNDLLDEVLYNQKKVSYQRTTYAMRNW